VPVHRLLRKEMGVEMANTELLLYAEAAPDLELVVDGGASAWNWQKKWAGVYSAELANLGFPAQHEIVVKSSGSFDVANEGASRAIDPGCGWMSLLPGRPRIVFRRVPSAFSGCAEPSYAGLTRESIVLRPEHKDGWSGQAVKWKAL
jgi:hypothetical protein